MSTAYNRDAFADLMSSLSTYALNSQIPGSPSTSQRPDFFQSLYNTGAFDTQNVPSLSTPAFTSTSQSPDFFQSLYDQGYVTGSPSNATATVLNPAGDYGFSVGSIGSNANLTDAIPTVTTPGFSIGNMDSDLQGIGIGTNMSPIYNTSTLDNMGFQLNPDSALGSTLNFDALNLPNMGPFQDDSNIEEITVTGQRPNQGNTLNVPTVTASNTNLDLGGGDDGEQRQPDENTSPIEEIIVKGVKNAANTLIPGFSLMTGAYDFFKDLPEGDFTAEELENLDKADDAANLYVDSQPTFLLDSGAGTGTTGAGGVNVPGLGIGSLGGSRGFVGTQDVLVPATGQMGDIYSIRPGDTRGRFAAPAYVNPYADVAAVDTPLRPGFVPTAPGFVPTAPGFVPTAPGGEMRTMPLDPIAAVDGLTPQPDTSGNFSGTAVTDQGSQPPVLQPPVLQPPVLQPPVNPRLQPTVTQPTVTQPTVTQPTDNTDFYTARDTNNTGQTLTVNDTTGTVGEGFDFLTGGTSTVLQPTVTQPTVTPPTVTQPPVLPPTVITDPPDVMTPREILDSITSEDGFSGDEQQQIADLLSSGEIGIGNVMNEFDVESGDVVEGLLRGGFQTPEQLTEMIRGYGNEGFEEKDLIADLLNQGRTTPEEVAGYYSANRPEFADLTPEAVTGYLNEINMGRLQI